MSLKTEGASAKRGISGRVEEEEDEEEEEEEGKKEERVKLVGMIVDFQRRRDLLRLGGFDGDGEEAVGGGVVLLISVCFPLVPFKRSLRLPIARWGPSLRSAASGVFDATSIGVLTLCVPPGWK